MCTAHCILSNIAARGMAAFSGGFGYKGAIVRSCPFHCWHFLFFLNPPSLSSNPSPFFTGASSSLETAALAAHPSTMAPSCSLLLLFLLPLVRCHGNESSSSVAPNIPSSNIHQLQVNKIPVGGVHDPVSQEKTESESESEPAPAPESESEPEPAVNSVDPEVATGEITPMVEQSGKGTIHLLNSDQPNLDTSGQVNSPPAKNNSIFGKYWDSRALDFVKKHYKNKYVISGGLSVAAAIAMGFEWKTGFVTNKISSFLGRKSIANATGTGNSSNDLSNEYPQADSPFWWWPQLANLSLSSLAIGLVSLLFLFGLVCYCAEPCRNAFDSDVKEEKEEKTTVKTAEKSKKSSRKSTLSVKKTAEKTKKTGEGKSKSKTMKTAKALAQAAVPYVKKIKSAFSGTSPLSAGPSRTTTTTTTNQTTASKATNNSTATSSASPMISKTGASMTPSTSPK